MEISLIPKSAKSISWLCINGLICKVRCNIAGISVAAATSWIHLIYRPGYYNLFTIGSGQYTTNSTGFIQSYTMNLILAITWFRFCCFPLNLYRALLAKRASQIPFFFHIHISYIPNYLSNSGTVDIYELGRMVVF